MISEITGVIPLPPANRTMGRSGRRMTKRPLGGAASMTSPGRGTSLNQLEPGPPRTRLTVTCISSSQAGALDSE